MIVLTGGGTGGHLSIIKALKIELLKKNEKILYIGSSKGQDKDWFFGDKDFLHTYFLPSRGFSKGIINKFLAFVFFIYSMVLVLFIFRKYKIKKVISVGGFSSAPSSFIALLLRCDLYIHEQNAVIGRLNKLCKPLCKAFFCSFPQDKSITTGYPILKDFFTHSKERKEVKKVLFLGGSRGANFINDLAINTSSFLKKQNIQIIHQTGTNDFDRVKKAYDDKKIKADVFVFSDKLYEKMQEADFAISRAGASSLWELASNGLPTIFIPYPYAIYDHQYHNANYLVSKNIGFIVRQDGFNQEKFQEYFMKKISSLNPSISNISVKLRKLSLENGARDIINIIEDK